MIHKGIKERMGHDQHCQDLRVDYHPMIHWRFPQALNLVNKLLAYKHWQLAYSLVNQHTRTIYKRFAAYFQDQLF
jgi:hypothetical protein